MEFEVLSNIEYSDRKVVEVLPRRHNAEKSWTSEEIFVCEWRGQERYTRDKAGNEAPKTGPHYKADIRVKLGWGDVPLVVLGDYGTDQDGWPLGLWGRLLSPPGLGLLGSLSLRTMTASLRQLWRRLWPSS